MTPTQAQIEAAAKAIDEEAFSMPDDLTPSERMYWEANKPVRQAIARERANAALTAAAEVGPSDDELPHCNECGAAEPYWNGRYSTAAAEVGGQQTAGKDATVRRLMDEIERRREWDRKRQIDIMGLGKEIAGLRAAINYALLRSPWDSEPTKVQTLEKLRNALTTAAEVEEPVDKYYAMSIDRRNTIIERCAQVAESTTYMSGAHIAAAIRALNK